MFVQGTNGGTYCAIWDSGTGIAQENSGHKIVECWESGLGDTDYHQRKIKRGYDFHHNPFICMVGTIELEPTTRNDNRKLTTCDYRKSLSHYILTCNKKYFPSLFVGNKTRTRAADKERNGCCAHPIVLKHFY
jgi:hypothetical protein